MKLYASLTSPFARKIRILVAEKSIRCELVETDPTGKDSPVPSLNPLGKVPVLVRDDGSALFDSPVIIEFLDAAAPPAFIPSQAEDRFDVLRWQALADGMMDATVQRLLETRRKPEQQSKSAFARQEEKLTRALAYADERAVAPYLVGGQLTLADVALGVALDYIDLRHPHDWRASCPALTSWHQRIGERPSFVATRPPGLPRD